MSMEGSDFNILTKLWAISTACFCTEVSFSNSHSSHPYWLEKGVRKVHLICSDSQDLFSSSLLICDSFVSSSIFSQNFVFISFLMSVFTVASKLCTLFENFVQFCFVMSAIGSALGGVRSECCSG